MVIASDPSGNFRKVVGIDTAHPVNKTTIENQKSCEVPVAVPEIATVLLIGRKSAIQDAFLDDRGRQTKFVSGPSDAVHEHTLPAGLCRFRINRGFNLLVLGSS